MCCCGKPSVNGTPNAYSWDGREFMTWEPNPPALKEGDELLYDEPGRCDKIDSHAHHFRLVKAEIFGLTLLVRHGGGDERIGLRDGALLLAPLAAASDSDARYWFFHALYRIHSDATEAALNKANAYWRQAAAEKRIKTRKLRGQSRVKVTVEPPRQTAMAAFLREIAA